MNVRAIHPIRIGWLLCAFAIPLAAAPNAGKIAGVVVDSSGAPRMGASVVVSAEQLAVALPIELLTNGRGRFSTATIPPGDYSIKVTLNGFMPSVAEHVQVTSRQATLLQIVLGSAFSSFEKLRRQPDEKIAPDDWTWVLRSSAATRSILRWEDGQVISGASSDSQRQADYGRFELTSGADHPGSIANLADSPATGFGYDMGIGPTARLLMAGQVSYEGAAPAGAFAMKWLPSGKEGTGPVTTMAVRESRLGPQGPVFRALRIAQDNRLALSDRVSVRYGGEYVVAGFQGTASALRPRAEVAVRMGNGWTASALVASSPWQDDPAAGGPIESAMDALDQFPMVLLRNGSPVLENSLHEEIAIDRELSGKASVSAAVFHDHSSHTGVVGRGSVSGPNFLQDYFSSAFAYDGGDEDSAGARLAYRRKLSKNVSATFVYDYAGALGPSGFFQGGELRSQLSTQYRHSVAGRVSAKIPHLGTQIISGYKWLDGPVVSQQDPYGEAVYHLDPYLSMEVRQPLPPYFPCHMEFLADVGNLLAQGYVSMATSDGRIVLVPSYRYFKGGLSFQF